MDKEQIELTLQRISLTSDGIDFIELLRTMSKNNYHEFKRSNSELNDIYKGQAIALDGLIELFEKCSLKTGIKSEQIVPEIF